MTAIKPAWNNHAPLPWAVDDTDPKCVRDARWIVVVDVMTGNDEADAQIAQLIADAGNASPQPQSAGEEPTGSTSAPHPVGTNR